MANNFFEQFGEAYSRWSILDKVGKEMQLDEMWQKMTAAYNYLLQVYNSRGYLTRDEANYANQISQILKEIQNQKMALEKDLTDEMMRHIIKMEINQMRNN